MILSTFIFSLTIVAIALLMLGINVFFRKKKFPNSHVGSNKALAKKGIKCATTQDREAQQSNLNKF
jgi:hypothetical protein